MRKKSRFAGKVASNAHQQKMRGSQYGYLNLPRGITVFKETPGAKIKLDIVPYRVSDKRHPDRNAESGIATIGELWYKRPYRVHRGIGVNNDSAVCPASIGLPCPVCQFRSKRIKEGAPDEEVRALKSSMRNLYVVIPKGSKDYEEKPHIWDISQFCFQDQLNDELEENSDYDIFPDLEQGYTLRIRFSEEMMGKNKFAKTSRVDFEKREEQYDEDLLKQTHFPDLDVVLSIPTFAELERKFFELDEPSDKPADEDEEIPALKKHMRKAAPEPEEDDDDKDDDEEEEKSAKRPMRRRESDEEARPSRRLPGQRREEEEPDEDDEEDEEEDEEKPAPKSMRRSKPAKPVRDDNDEEEIKTNCIACSGSGTNSKGKTCPICRGTGKRLSREKPKGKCPHGHKFGTDDCEKYNDCDGCDLWDDCYDAKE